MFGPIYCQVYTVPRITKLTAWQRAAPVPSITAVTPKNQSVLRTRRKHVYSLQLELLPGKQTGGSGGVFVYRCNISGNIYCGTTQRPPSLPPPPRTPGASKRLP